MKNNWRKINITCIMYPLSLSINSSLGPDGKSTLLLIAVMLDVPCIPNKQNCKAAVKSIYHLYYRT